MNWLCLASIVGHACQSIFLSNYFVNLFQKCTNKEVDMNDKVIPSYLILSLWSELNGSHSTCLALRSRC